MATVAEVEKVKKLLQALKEKEQKITWELEQVEKDPEYVLDPGKSLQDMLVDLRQMEYDWDDSFQKFMEKYHKQMELPSEEDDS